MRELNNDQVLKIVTTTPGTIPAGALYIMVYNTSATGTWDGIVMPIGGMVYPFLPDFYYSEIDYDPGGTNMYIRAFYPNIPNI